MINYPLSSKIKSGNEENRKKICHFRDKRVPAFLIRFEDPLTSILSPQAGRGG
jgi:hypothetical protein